MNRNLQSALWTCLILGVWSGMAALRTGVTPDQVLTLGPNPWLGLAGALVVASISVVPAWSWMRDSRGLRHTDHGLTWEPRGVQAFQRLVITATTAYALATALWLWLGPPVLVDLAPFLSGLAGPVQATCDLPNRIPPDVMWAVDGMCLWNAQRLLPTGVGALILGVFSMVLGISVYRSTEVLKLELDSRGVYVATEAGSERLPWTEIAAASHVDPDVVVHLHDGTEHRIPAHGLSASELTELVMAIDRHKREPEKLSKAERKRLEKLEKLGS